MAFTQIKKLSLSFFLIASFTAYVFLNRAQGGLSTLPASIPVLQPSPSPTSAPRPGAYKDGSYTGSPSYAYTGTIQVTAIIAGGTITEVRVLDASRADTSKQINATAIPTLKTETLKAQHAKVDAVSGATYTSAAYIESLTSALTQARA